MWFFFYFLAFLVKLFFLLFSSLFFYVIVLLVRLLYLLLVLPVSVFNMTKLFLTLLSSVVLKIVLFVWGEFRVFCLFVWRFFVVESYIQLLYHFSYVAVFRDRAFRRYYFYRRVYRLSGSSLLLLAKSI